MKYPHRNLSFHDIHTLHHITTADEIMERLLSAFDKEKLVGVDIIYFPGDFFDRVVLFSDPRLINIFFTMAEIFRRCEELNITFRVLEGTPSHDGKQGYKLAQLAQQTAPKLDFRYVTDMEIEYIDKFDMTVMYVPDEWASREQMYLTARKLLADNNLEQVDFIIGHNQFSYQFTPNLRGRISTLDEEAWNDMVRHTAYFGHIHRRSTYKKIEVAGSFDRIAHGEEDPKGYLEGRYYNDNDREIIFHENKEAAIFKTITLDSQFSIEDKSALEDILKQCAVFNRDRFNVRFSYDFIDTSEQVKQLIRECSLVYPLARFTELSKANSKRIDEPEYVSDETYDYIDITPSNVVRLVSELIPDMKQSKDDILSLLSDYVSKVR